MGILTCFWQRRLPPRPVAMIKAVLQYQTTVDKWGLSILFSKLAENAGGATAISDILFLPLDLLIKDTYNKKKLIAEGNIRNLIMTTKSDDFMLHDEGSVLYNMKNRLVIKPEDCYGVFWQSLRNFDRFA